MSRLHVRKFKLLTALLTTILVAAVGVSLLVFTRAAACTGVTIPAGASIQNAINANSTGATFCLAAGTYTGQGNIVPKDGDVFIGAGRDATILNGNGQYRSFTGSASNVRIQSLQITNYNPNHLDGVLDGMTSHNWTMYDLHVTHNGPTSEGIVVGPGSLVDHVLSDYNGNVGIGTGSRNQTGVQPFADLQWTVQNSELAYNGSTDPTDGGGAKVLWTSKGSFINVYSHDNHGMGLWCDAYCSNMLYKDNIVKNNFLGGIFHEISYNAEITGNVIANNGNSHCYSVDPNTEFSGNDGIALSESHDVNAHNNTISGNCNPIFIYNGHKFSNWVYNISVHDNNLIGAQGYGGAYYNDQNGTVPAASNWWSTIHFDRDNNDANQRFFWSNGLLNLAGWHSVGQDPNPYAGGAPDVNKVWDPNSSTGGNTTIVLSSISPNHGPQAGGTSVTLTGNNFASPASVTFGGKAATSVSVVNATTITAVAPSGTGTVAVAVTINSQTATLNSAYSYDVAATTGPFPGPGAPSLPRTLEAENYDTGGEGVSYHDADTTNSGGSSYRGADAVDVKDETGTSNNHVIGFFQDGEWLNYSVNIPAAGSYTVTAKMANTAAGGQLLVSVDGGSALATLIVPNTGSYTVFGNTNTATINLPAGGHKITLKAASAAYIGDFDSATFATVTPTVQLTSLSPNHGAAAGGTSVTLTGSGFAAGATVSFGGKAATNVSVASSTSITATAPSGSGVVSVSVTTNGQTATLANSYTYDSTPTTTPQSPFPGPNPAALPGNVEAENYDKGGENISYHDLTSNNQGASTYRGTDAVDVKDETGTGNNHVVGYFQSGEWLEYSVSVPAAGKYNMSAHMANAYDSGQVQVSVDGGTTLATMNVPNTGSYTTFANTPSVTINLSAGTHVIRLTAATTSYIGDLDYFTVSSVPVTTTDTTPPSVPTGLTTTWRSKSSVVFTWSASTDNVKVTGYKVYRNGVLVGSTTSLSFTDTGLHRRTTYSYTVRAFDAAGNLSAPSSPLYIKTL